MSFKQSGKFYWRGPHLAIDFPAARAVFTSRLGGCSAAPFDSLNLGLMTEDLSGSVERNYGLLADRLGLAGTPIACLNQVHGSEVVTRESAVGPLPSADGQVTQCNDIALAVQVADCLPVVIATSGAVAAVHAGWRGLQAGVLGRAVAKLRALDRSPIHAAIGPSIGPCCFQVGADVSLKFEKSDPGSKREDRIDLPFVATQRLLKVGVQTVANAMICTMCDPENRWFSHRRDAGQTGRQAGLIWRVGDA